MTALVSQTPEVDELNSKLHSLSTARLESPAIVYFSSMWSETSDNAPGQTMPGATKCMGGGERKAIHVGMYLDLPTVLLMVFYEHSLY